MQGKRVNRLNNVEVGEEKDRPREVSEESTQFGCWTKMMPRVFI